MKKILFIVTQSEMGGAQRYIYEICRGLDKENYEILVAAGEGDGELFQKLQQIETRSLSVLSLKQMKRAPWPWQIILAVREIYDLLKKEKPDVLFLCSTTAGFLGSIAGFLLKIGNCKLKIVYRIGGWAFRDPRAFWKNWFVLLAEKIIAPLKDIIIVNSEVDRKLALKYKIAPEKKLIKIYNGIDINSLDFLSKEEARNSLTVSNTAKLVGCVANFYKTKGLEYLIESFRYIDGSPTAIIIGDGRERPKLEALIKKYGLRDKVVLAGRIPDAYRYLKAFDVFVLPSLKEGFPWIILEAIAAGVPIVATKVGAVPEILDEEFLVEPGDSQELAKKIDRMLKHPVMAELRQEFTCQKMLEETEKILFP